MNQANKFFYSLKVFLNANLSIIVIQIFIYFILFKLRHYSLFIYGLVLLFAFYEIVKVCINGIKLNIQIITYNPFNTPLYLKILGILGVVYNVLIFIKIVTIH